MPASFSNIAGTKNSCPGTRMARSYIWLAFLPNTLDSLRLAACAERG